RVNDAAGAHAALAEAARLEPDFPLAYAALAEASRRLGHPADEQAEAKRAFDASAQLPRQEQLLVEARWRVANRDWPRAIELYRALHAFYPASLEYGLGLAEVQTQSAHAADALATLDQLRAGDDDPRVELQRARADGMLGRFGDEAKVAALAVGKARALGARQLTAEALLLQSYALDKTGDRARAAALADESFRIYREAGEPRGVGEALMRCASSAWQSGDLATAHALFDEAVKHFAAL